jgi:hypothetical protein
MIVHFLHGRTHVPLYATPAVAKPEVWAVLQSTTTPILSFLYDRFSRKIRPAPFLPINYLRLWPQQLIQRPFLRLRLQNPIQNT